MKISVCIPMYNESKVIANTAKSLSIYMDSFFEDYEIIFSDDGSSDGCADIVRSLNYKNVRVLRYEKNMGKGCAVRTAILAAKGDIILFTDSDLAYGTDVIGRLYDTFAASPDADMVIGSRNASSDGYEGYTLVRKVASKAYIKLLKMVGGLKNTDSQCGFKGFRAPAAKKIFSLCEVNGFAFDFEVLLIAQKKRFKIVEMPVRVINHGTSKVHMVRDTIRMLKALRQINARIDKLDTGR